MALLGPAALVSVLVDLTSPTPCRSAVASGIACQTCQTCQTCQSRRTVKIELFGGEQSNEYGFREVGDGCAPTWGFVDPYTHTNEAKAASGCLHGSAYEVARDSLVASASATTKLDSAVAQHVLELRRQHQQLTRTGDISVCRHVYRRVHRHVYRCVDETCVYETCV